MKRLARWLLLVLVPCPGLAAQEAPDFRSEVLPVLSDKCFLCHGPDASSRKAGLRLDLESAARLSGVLTVDVDGDSEFGFRITDDDPSSAMPPPEAKHGLSEAERAVLLRWIESGAGYERHWAFEPLPEVVPAPSNGEAWARSPLDRFVAEHHDQLGLTPAEPASPGRWLRRVTYDLAGLPPTPEDVLAFESDPSDAARSVVVDRLLASPAYGERMAIPWLDVARYADSWGYQSDQLAPFWPWRDWVVAALNDNMPFDQFLTEQLAGDLLPEPTQDQRLATAFNRLHRMTNEGGSIQAERIDASVVDRVETLGTAVMGLTLGCARCHDHKFDPISQAEFYGLYGYFNSIDEWGTYHDSSRVPTPTLLIPSPEQQRKLGKIAAILEECEQAQAELEEPIRGGGLTITLEDNVPPAPTEATTPGLVAALDFEDEPRRVDGMLRVGGMDGEFVGVKLATEAQWVAREGGHALRLDGDVAVILPRVGPLGPSKPFTLSLSIRVPEGIQDGVILHQSGGTDVGYFGFDILLVDGHIQARQVRFWPGNAVAIESKFEVKPGQWHRVHFSQMGTGWAKDMRLSVDGNQASTVLRDGLTKRPFPGHEDLLLGARFRGAGVPGVLLDDFFLWNRALRPFEWTRLTEPSAEEWLSSHTFKGGAEITSEILELWRVKSKDEQRRARAFVQVLADVSGGRRDQLEWQTKVMEVPVMEETAATFKAAHVLERGAYDAPRTPETLVGRQVPKSLMGEREAPPRDRLGLARWLVSDDHPLTSRVAVNRIWQTLFGTGLVGTPGDFGLQGAQPSHPELLDWLARRFVASGWDQKALIKEVVLSATYAQDSAVSPERRGRDPENRWLSRGPSGRLSAEMLRDTALFVSGLLEPGIGGPPVSPYQPPGLWRESNSMSPAYVQSVGEGLYRRSIYSVVKRTAPLPNMLALDAPMRETSCARRERTSTPLQALVLMNDVQFVEAARVLAARSLHDADTPKAAAAMAFTRMTGRSPDGLEIRTLVALYEVELAAFSSSPSEAEALLSEGDTPLPEGVDQASLAAMTATCQIIMNLDAAVWKR